MLNIRVMTFDDILLGMHLKEQAGWNQTETDWRRFIDLQPGGCFVGEMDGSPVATATTCVLDSVAWIGMVLVEESVRGRGIGTRMMEYCIEYLNECGVETMRLDATPAGQKVYEKLGFEADYELVRMQGTAESQDAHRTVEPLKSERLQEVWDFDADVRGMQRHSLLQRLYDHAPNRMSVVFSNGRVAGYMAHRDGVSATQIGPAVAVSDEVGRGLADTALNECAGRRVFVDIPTDNKPAMDWARSRGLEIQRPLMRMHLGKFKDDNPLKQWASSGPEKG